MKNEYENWSKEDLITEVKKLRSQKRYGLVWETSQEYVVEQCKKNFPVLDEIPTKSILNNKLGSNNIIIEGDNYHALSVLNYTHKGKIDVIYIDPPYNTGAKDWKYNNDYVDINDQWRHSKWISFIRNRLVLAKSLLSRNGVLIVAIDDNELCTLGLLLEEIFPYRIRNTVVIVNNPHGVSRSGFSRCHEYALFLLNPSQSVNKKKVPEDAREINLRRSGNNSLRKDSPTMFYPIHVDKVSLKISGVGETPKDDFHPIKRMVEFPKYYEVWPIDNKGTEKNWYYSRNRVAQKGSEELFCKWVKDQLHIYFNHSNNSEQTYKSVWTGSEYDAGAYGATLVKQLAETEFPFPKSINTVKDCLRAVLSKKDSIVLDFFAGSGTTGHAVLNLNKEDSGNRRFILCTNNENKIAEEVCYPRIKKVMQGYNNGTIKADGLGGNLRYFKTNFVDGQKTDKCKSILTHKAVGMLCLREDTFTEVFQDSDIKIFANSDRYTAVLLNVESLSNFKKKISVLDKTVNVYIFSLSNDLYEEEFEEFGDKVTVSPIPEAIYKVYKRIFQ